MNGYLSTYARAYIYKSQLEFSPTDSVGVRLTCKRQQRNISKSSAPTPLVRFAKCWHYNAFHRPHGTFSRSYLSKQTKYFLWKQKLEFYRTEHPQHAIKNSAYVHLRNAISRNPYISFF